jgi:hypothetical protein
MMPHTVAGAVYVFSDEPGAPLHVERALAGPFADGEAARRWILADGEAKLDAERRVAYDRLKAQAGGEGADVGHLLALLMMVACRKTVDAVMAGPVIEEPKPLSRRLVAAARVEREREPGED